MLLQHCCPTTHTHTHTHTPTRDEAPQPDLDLAADVFSSQSCILPLQMTPKVGQGANALLVKSRQIQKAQLHEHATASSIAGEKARTLTDTQRQLLTQQLRYNTVKAKRVLVCTKKQ